jgi:hypothetical protein
MDCSGVGSRIMSAAVPRRESASSCHRHVNKIESRVSAPLMGMGVSGGRANQSLGWRLRLPT